MKSLYVMYNLCIIVALCIYKLKNHFIHAHHNCYLLLKDTKWEFNNYFEELLYYCVLASVCYINENIVPFRCNVIQSNNIFDKIYSTGIILHGKKEHIISFRSTGNLDEILIAYDNKMLETLDGYIHSGYFNQTLETYFEVVKYLNVKEKSNVIICGHSLGGTIASILGILLSRHKNLTIQTYAFGSPKFGDNTCKEKLKKRKNLQINYIVNECDVVCKIPYKCVEIGNYQKFNTEKNSAFGNHKIKTYIEYAKNIQPSKERNTFEAQFFKFGLKYI